MVKVRGAALIAKLTDVAVAPFTPIPEPIVADTVQVPAETKATLPELLLMVQTAAVDVAKLFVPLLSLRLAVALIVGDVSVNR